MTENKNLPARSFQPQFKSLIQAVFEKRAYFGDFFGGGIEALDGVQHNDYAFSVKTSDIAVVTGRPYDTGGEVAFNSGTADSTRFGERKEIIYTNTQVPYTWTWAFHEGIDKFTVNNEFNAAIADRLDLQAQAKIGEFNAHHAGFISTNAGKVEQVSSYDPQSVLLLFNGLSAYFTNIQAVGEKTAKVTPELYNAIVDHPAATTAKHSSANIDSNVILMFKGFAIEEVPEAMFEDNEVCYAYIKGVGKAFTGINTARTFESEDFDGVALQGAGRAGEFILADNKAAVVKVEKTSVYPIDVTGVELLPNNATGTSGEAGEKQFTPTVSPSNATDKSVTYSITPSEDITVAGNGLVEWTDIAAGVDYTITVTTTDGDFTDTSTLKLRA